MNDSYPTTPEGDGQSPSAPPTNVKYIFDPARVVLLDVEVYPGQPARWCCGFLNLATGRYSCLDGDRDQLAAVLDKLHRAGRTLVGYNSEAYDEPVLRAILAGEDAYLISRALIGHDGPGLPPELRDRAACWPTIRADRVDLAARTRMNGRFPSLKVVAANLGVRHLAELPFEPDQELTDQEWIEVKQYNRKDVSATKVVLEHFSPELAALAALSNRYDLDLRNIHQAGIAAKILCAAYRHQNGCEPVRVEPPALVRYTPPGEVRRPQNPVAAAWHDRLCSEAFPMVVPKGATHPRPVVPESPEPIVVGGVTLNVGSGGIHSADGASLHRSDQEYAIYETDVASFYPSMMAGFGIAPRSLGDCGSDLFAEILAERLAIKEQAAQATDPTEAKRLKTMADGLKIVLNATFGQFGNPWSVLYDPEALLAVTLSGQLLLLDLVERLVGVGVEILSVNTDGLYFKARRDDGGWREALSDWQEDTGMTLETTEVEALVIEATNNYCVRYADGKVKRRGTLGGSLSWKNVPNSLIVADAVVAALLDGTLPEHTVRRCTDPVRFACITRRQRDQTGVLLNEDTGAEEPLPRLVRWYKAKGSPYRIEHRWVDGAGKEHKTTPPGATNVQLLMDLPEPGQSLGDIDYNWYVGEARARILANPNFPHLDPKWLDGLIIAQFLHALGLCPSPHWAGKKSLRGTRKNRPSYFYNWSNYHTVGIHTGPELGVLVLDIDDPPKFRKWVDGLGSSPQDRWASLGDCLSSYHRGSSPKAVRAGAAKGKLIFKFEASEDHPLAKVGKAALRSVLGIEIFYGHGDPTIFGDHPDGPGQDYALAIGPFEQFVGEYPADLVGPPPDWLIAGLVERATPKIPKPRAKQAAGGNGAPANGAAVARYAMVALDGEVAKVASAEEGSRNCTTWAASCAIGSLVGAGVVDRAEAEEALAAATTLPTDEAADVIRRGLDKGAEVPRDLDHVGKNGDGFERPTVEITTEEHEVNDKAIAALSADPDLYQRGNLLVRVLREEPRPDDMDTGRDPGSLAITTIHAATLRERLTRHACWVKRKKGEDGEPQLVPAHPPDWSVQAVANRGTWRGIRPLEGVTEVPLLRADGSILETPGYDRRSGILYTPEIEYPKVPESPTREDAQAAVQKLYDPVVDFPFKDENHKAAWLSALLTAFARPTLPGPAPLFLFDANTSGAGKTFLADIISIVGIGRSVGRTTLPSSEEEMDKCTLAMAVHGAKMVLFDNTATGSAIGGPALDAALTAMTRSGRLLGATKWMEGIPFSPLFVVTGNNAALKADILRRIVASRLESPEEHPEERDGFAIPNLLEHVRAHRGSLAVAALTILRAYIVAGRPIPEPKPKPVGAPFGPWDALVRHATYWATGYDPHATKGSAKTTDKTTLQLPDLIEGWAVLCRAAGKEGLTSGQAIRELEKDPADHESLRALLTESTRDGKLPSPQQLGNLLGKVRGRVVKGRSLNTSVYEGTNLWFVHTLPTKGD